MKDVNAERQDTARVIELQGPQGTTWRIGVGAPGPVVRATEGSESTEGGTIDGGA